MVVADLVNPKVSVKVAVTEDSLCAVLLQLATCGQCSVRAWRPGHAALSRVLFEEEEDEQ